jgi:hypothetical protein
MFYYFIMDQLPPLLALRMQNLRHFDFLPSGKKTGSFLQSSAPCPVAAFDLVDCQNIDQQWIILPLFFTASRLAVGLTQLPLQWVPGDLPPGIRLLERHADHFPSCSFKVKKLICVYVQIYRVTQ